MRESPDNPQKNKLAEGTNEDNLIGAIESSGYPLQGIVANKLKSEFSVVEEWSYLDRDTKEPRSLDIFAFKKLRSLEQIKPSLVLLIECKRSRHPYVFFKNVVNWVITPFFPKIVFRRIKIEQRVGGAYREVAANEVLGLIALDFVLQCPYSCSAFSRAEVNGEKVKLSGLEPFNKLILPLVKASDHTFSMYRQFRDGDSIAPTLILNLSIVDGPMIVVEDPNKASDPILTPWVRVPRQEAYTSDNNQMQYKYYVVDIVHIDYLDEFISRHLTPFVEQYLIRMKRQESVLLNGGIVEDLENWNWDEINAVVKRQ